MESSRLFVVLLFVAIAAGFISLGSWLYRHPRRLIPRWSIFNRENSEVQKVARAYATFMIFFGAFALFGIASVYFSRRVPGTPILALAAAIALALFIRSRLKKSVAVPAKSIVAAPADVAPKQPLLSIRWKRNLLIVVGFLVVLIAVLLVAFGNSDVSKMALAAAQASPTVRQELGEPIKRGVFTSGSIEVSGASGKTDLAIPISGSKGKATLYVVAHKSADLWKLETLLVSFNEGARFDLLKEASGADQP